MKTLFWKDGDTYRNRYIEFTPGFHWLSLGITLSQRYDDESFINICIGWGNLYVKFNADFLRLKSELNYKLYYFESTFWIIFGRKTVGIDMPWFPEWIRTSYLLDNGGWYHETRLSRDERRRDEQQDVPKLFERHGYTYRLKNWEVQSMWARISVEEREWRPKWFKWTKLFAKISKTISVEFDSEIGEVAGSWKGGCTGCSYEILEGETPLMALRRMERERKF